MSAATFRPEPHPYRPQPPTPLIGHEFANGAVVVAAGPSAEHLDDRTVLATYGHEFVVTTLPAGPAPAYWSCATYFEDEDEAVDYFRVRTAETTSEEDVTWT
ncbi:hypothetical protein IA539_00890 [Gordonia sp. zg691]|uniref:hypothetical protein n=1 Tax=Gordonia jinghuaiqii TaxID=2758710 RepID=UPI00166221A1|nr:hypothetical protein [Gordonia jinghuaiqii]MBD0859773.1 hypothetical protein [Gordonia jinghuaiqii]